MLPYIGSVWGGEGSAGLEGAWWKIAALLIAKSRRPQREPVSVRARLPYTRSPALHRRLCLAPVHGTAEPRDNGSDTAHALRGK